MSDQEAPTGPPQHHNLIEEWVDLGPGPCPGEILRARNAAHGAVVAVVRQRKGYKPGSVSNPSADDNVLRVVEEWTTSMVFLAGVRFAKIPDPNATPAPSPASPPAPSPESDASSPEPAPGAVVAGATESR